MSDKSLMVSPTKEDAKKAPKVAKKSPKVAKPTKGPYKLNLKAGAIKFGKARRDMIRIIMNPKQKKNVVTKRAPTWIKKPLDKKKKDGAFKWVCVKKLPSYYPTAVKASKPKGLHPKSIRCKLRKNLTPGTICIVVAGPHKGKRVVFLKQLASGLCLITGPHVINECPLRRINQMYLIATETKISFGPTFAVPPRVDDAFFKRRPVKQKKLKKDDPEGMENKTYKYTPNHAKKMMQKKVDLRVLKALQKTKTINGGHVRQYLRKKLELRKNQYPHHMKF